ncbi:MAG: hypothetical protein IT234_03035 [Bacteroidia bacterium]|nr:hypothetical protein [Bacteroidia bacterium]
MKNIFILILICFFAHSITAQEKNEFEKKYEMKTYYMVFLKKGPNRDQDSATVVKLQEQHIAHLTKMADAGKMDLAGPFMDKGDIRGICVYNVATKEEAEKLANEDPMVKAGRLIVEIHPWYAAKDSKLK